MEPDIQKLLDDNIMSKLGQVICKIDIDMDKIKQNVTDNFVKRGLTLADVRKI